MGRFLDQPFQPLSVGLPDGGEGRRTMARFICASCAAKSDFPVGGGKLVPEMVVKRAADAGWEVRHGRARAVCPRCSNKRAVRGESPGPKVITPANVVVQDLSPVTASPPPVAPRAPVVDVNTYPRQPSIGQRFQVMELLDTHFDGTVGGYLDQMSDEALAALAQVHPEVVGELRDELYGPIKVVPQPVVAAPPPPPPEPEPTPEPKLTLPNRPAWAQPMQVPKTAPTRAAAPKPKAEPALTNGVAGLRDEFDLEMLRLDAEMERLERQIDDLREQAAQTQTSFLARLWALETNRRQ
jgi:hypothetical protein